MEKYKNNIKYRALLLYIFLTNMTSVRNSDSSLHKKFIKKRLRDQCLFV